MFDFVICGLEHSGTTLLSDLFRQVNDLDSGFEVGVLLGESPRDFPTVEPFFFNMIAGWEVSEGQLQECCDTDDFMEFYKRLSVHSPLIDEANAKIFDKTPRYLAHLDAVFERIASPIIATYKDPRAIVYSDFKRASVSNFDDWMDEYTPKKHQYMSSAYRNFKKYSPAASRVKFVSLEEMSLNTHSSLSECFAFVGHEFNLDYLFLNRQRYKNTKGRVVSAGVALEYRENFTKDQQRRILNEFSDFDSWFYD